MKHFIGQSNEKMVTFVSVYQIRKKNFP